MRLPLFIRRLKNWRASWRNLDPSSRRQWSGSMEEPGSSDHLNSSLTDLMTSLMVIFILLLLVFLHRTAGKDAAVTDVLLKRLRSEMQPQGFNENTIRPDPRDRNAILVI